MEAAQSASGYEELPKPTTVMDLHKAAIKHGGFEKQCMARKGGCPVPMTLFTLLAEGTLGEFDWREPTVVKVSTVLTPGTLKFNEVLVHEFVHQLQFMFGEYGPAKEGCANMGDIEEKAYNADAAYLAEFGITVDYSGKLIWMRMGFSMCAAEGS